MVEPGNGGVRAAGPRADTDRIAFAVPDPEHRLAGVRLLPELDLPAAHRDFDFDFGVWRLELPPPSAARMEYRVELQHPDGGIETTTDPGNPRSTPGAFGPKSVLELPGYAAPAWLDRVPPWPVSAELSIDTAVGPVEVTVRSPAAATRRLLLAHDGPEYDALAALGGFAAALERDARLPRSSWPWPRRAHATSGTRRIPGTATRWPPGCCRGCTRRSAPPARRC